MRVNPICDQLSVEDLAVIIEVAAMNFRLKRMGHNAAEQFTSKLADVIEDNGQDE
ncbi:HPr kinase/phosphorylase [Bacillus safensis subsp. safensis]